MEEKKVVKIGLSTLFLILAIIIIVIMTVFMYKFYNEKIEANEKTAELQTQVSNLNKTVSSLQEKVDEINSDNMRHRVIVAIEIQKERFKNTNYRYNSEVVGKDVLRLFKLSKGAKKVLESYYKNYDITLRGYTKIIKVARTIADLECCDEIMDYHIIESIGFRKNVFGEII